MWKQACQCLTVSTSAALAFISSYQIRPVHHFSVSSYVTIDRLRCKDGMPRIPCNNRRPILSYTTGANMKLSSSSSTLSESTIYALSSGAGRAGVSVIRVSGPESGSSLAALCSKGSKMPAERQAVVRKLFDTQNPSELLDEAMVLWMPGPKTFTGEDTVELHTHGSRAVVSGMLSALGRLHGLRLAEPGEFTLRAFENGRLDLTSVEGLADLIASDTASQRKQALNQMIGNLRTLYEGWRSTLMKCLAQTEAILDFGDDEEDVKAAGVSIKPMITALLNSMHKHLSDHKRGEVIREGVQVAIVGPPNAGKSSLLNMLAERDAAIVSPVAGTTRDVIEVHLDLAGLPLILRDTAGIKEETESSDVIGERALETMNESVILLEGMQRALKAASSAHLVIFVSDSSSNGNQTECNRALKQVLEACRGVVPLVAVANKVDLVGDGSSTVEALDMVVPQEELKLNWWRLSCKTGEGFQELIDHMESVVRDHFESRDDEEGETGAIITRERHRRHIEKCRDFLEASQNPYLTTDLIAEELRGAITELGPSRITGAVDVEDILDVIFKDFCIAPELEQPVMQNIHHLLLPQEQGCCHSSICIALLAINITPSTKKKWLKLRQHVDAPLYSKFAMELRQ